MPTRVVRGEILNSRSLSRVSLGAELLFRNLIALVDDYGRYDGDPEIIAAHAYPRRRDVREKHVSGWLDELVNADGDGRGPVEVYAVNGRPFLRLVNWELHRGKSRRGEHSRWPEPTQATPEIEYRASAEIRGDPRGPARGVGESGSRGVEESGKDKRENRSRSAAKTPVPDLLPEQAFERVIEWGANQSPPLSRDQIVYGWKVFSAKARANGYAYVNHVQAFRNALGETGDSWALKGYGQSPTGDVESPAQAKARRTKEAGAKAYEMMQASKQQLGLVQIEGGRR